MGNNPPKPTTGGNDPKTDGPKADGLGFFSEQPEQDTMGQRTPLQARILQILGDSGWSQAQLSRKAGLGEGAVNDLMNHPERQPRAPTLRKIARAAGLPDDSLIDLGKTSLPPGFIEVSSDELRRWGPGAVLSGWADLLDSQGENYIAVLISTPARPEVRSVENVPTEAVTLIDTQGPFQAGQRILVRSPRGNGPRYFADPFLVGLDSTGSVFHEVRGEAGVEIVGRVICEHSWS